MERSNKNTAAAYIQAGISLLFILFTFLPFISFEGEDKEFSLSLFFSSLIAGTNEDIDIELKVCAYFFIVYFMLQAINLFIQAHGSNRLFSGFLSIIGGVSLIVAHLILDEKLNGDFFDYSVAFYLIIVLLIAQLVLPTLATLYTINTAAIQGKEQQERFTVDTKSESKSEIELLKEKISQLEKEEK